ncbi:MAG: hypothetical protein AAGM22_01970 [Acidobacteriota bacterium]
MIHKPAPRLHASLLVSFFFLFLLGTPEAAVTQTDDAASEAETEIDPALKDLADEVARLELEKKRAEALKAIAVADRDTAAAGLSTTEATGKEGSAKLDDGAGYYAELVAYATLGESAGKIVEALGTETADKAVILTEKADLSAEAALYDVILLKVSRFQDEFDQLTSDFSLDGQRSGLQQESLAITALTVSSLLGAAADIAAFFKVDREIKSRSVSLSKRALIAEVAQRMTAKKVLLPELTLAGARSLIPTLEAAQAMKSQQIEPRLRAIKRRAGQTKKDRDVAKANLDNLKKAKAEANQVVQARGALKLAEEALAAVQADQLRLEAAVTGFTNMVDALSSAPAGGGKSPLETVATVDLMRSDKNALLLYLDIPSQGAEIEIVDSVWSSARISYIGGSVVVFFLLDQDGSILASGSIPRHGASSFKGTDGSESLPVPTETIAKEATDG